MALSRHIFILITFVALASCDFEKDAKKTANLPLANGKPGEIIVVIDSAQWQGNVGKELRKIFHESVPFIPREEQLFALNQIAPGDFQSILKMQKNIIFVTVLGDKSDGNRRLKTYFTPESLKMIQEDPSLFMFEKQDEYARGQEVLHLFSETEDILINNLVKNKEKLQQHFLDIEEKRSYSALYSVKYEKGITQHIKEKLQCDLMVPIGFEIAMEENNFIWLRNFNPDVDKSVFISWVEYSSEDMFSLDSLIKLRTEISKPYILYKPEDPTSYMLTETDHFVVFRQEINFKGNYAVKLRGLWKINNYYMGGPFLSYAMVDKTTNRLYYIEAFLYSPGKPQRDDMRELDTILRTFNVSDSPV